MSHVLENEPAFLLFLHFAGGAIFKSLVTHVQFSNCFLIFLSSWFCSLAIENITEWRKRSSSLKSSRVKRGGDGVRGGGGGEEASCL